MKYVSWITLLPRSLSNLSLASPSGGQVIIHPPTMAINVSAVSQVEKRCDFLLSLRVKVGSLLSKIDGGAPWHRAKRSISVLCEVKLSVLPQIPGLSGDAHGPNVTSRPT